MKKYLYVLLAFLCLFLVGCGNDDNGGKGKDPIEINYESKELNLIQGEVIDFAVGESDEIENTNTESLVFENNKLKAVASGNFVFNFKTGNTVYEYSVSVIPENFKVKKNEFVLLTKGTGLMELDTNTKSKVTFESTNNTVATVDENGVITGVATGVCNVNAKTEYNTVSVTVEVIDTNNACNIVDDVIEMEVGKPQVLLVDSSNNKNDGVTFICDQKILEISKHGIVTPVKGGTEVITVRNKSGVTRVMTVNVIEKFEEVDFKDESKVNVYGRTKVSDKNELTVYHTASGFECVFEGTYFKATIFSTIESAPYAFLKIYLDDTEYPFGLDKGSRAEYTLAENLEDTVHTIKVLKRNEDSMGKLVFSNLKANLFVTPPKKPELKLEVYGDSYTAGYGALGKSTDPHNAGTEDGTLSYAYVASQKLNAQLNVYCYSGISIGIPGWIKDFFLPDIAPYYASQDKTPWDFNNYQADVIIVYLGTNDNYGLSIKQGTANDFKARYKAFLDFLLEKTPEAKIVCCYGFSAIDSSLESAIKAFPKSYPNKVFAFKLPTASLTGSNGHPNAASQVKGGEKLAEYISTTILPLLNTEEE